jgi:Fic family protein
MEFRQLSKLNIDLFDQYKQHIDFDVKLALDKAQEFDMPVDYFKFYKSVSSVYSSKIEGENIDFDSFFKHKFLNVDYKAEYTQKADDLFEAYDFIEEKPITLANLKEAHAIVTRNLLPKSQQGLIRTNPMFVVNDEDKIEYVAAPANIL